MIVVTGEPRTGTSLQMLILKNLGLNIGGEKYLNEFTKEFNPTGMWEVPGLTYEGLQFPVEWDAVKLAVRGFLRSRKHLFQKGIVCIRDPREVIVSNRTQQNHISDEYSVKQYLCYHALLSRYLTSDITEVLHFVDYGDVMWSPKDEIDRLCKFLELEPTQEAYDSVQPELYRSKKHKAKMTTNMKACYKFYEAFRHYIV